MESGDRRPLEQGGFAIIAPVVIVALLAAGTWRAARFDLQPQQEIDNALHLASDAPRLSRDA